MRNNQKVKNKNKNKKIKTKQNKKTQIPFKWILSKDTNHAFIRCYTSDHQKKKTGEMEVFSPGTYEYLVFGKLWVCV